MNGKRYYPRAIQPTGLHHLDYAQLSRCYERAVAWTEAIAARMDNPRLADADDNERAWHLVERISWQLDQWAASQPAIDRAMLEATIVAKNDGRYDIYALPYVDGAQA